MLATPFKSNSISLTHRNIRLLWDRTLDGEAFRTTTYFVYSRFCCYPCKILTFCEVMSCYPPFRNQFTCYFSHRATLTPLVICSRVFPSPCLMPRRCLSMGSEARGLVWVTTEAWIRDWNILIIVFVVWPPTLRQKDTNPSIKTPEKQKPMKQQWIICQHRKSTAKLIPKHEEQGTQPHTISSACLLLPLAFSLRLVELFN